jgi:hypothetical protein
MRFVICLISAIFLLPIALAAYSENIHDAWHYNNESFKAGNLDINLTGSSSQDTVMVDYGENRLLVKNKTCEETPKYFFCVETTRQGNFDYYWRYYRNQYKVVVKHKLAKLVVSRAVSSTSLSPGKDSTINLEILNTGSFAATDVHLEDPFPGFGIVDSKTCLIGDYAVVWDGSLLPDQMVKCSYTIRALNNASLRSFASVAYFDGSARSTANSAETTIVVAGTDIRFSATPSLDLEIGQSGSVFVSLNNTLPKDASVKSLTLTVPYGLRISNNHFWQKENDYKLRYSGVLSSLTGKVFDATIVAERSRLYRLALYLEYSVDNVEKVVARNITVAVSMPNLTIAYDLPESLIAGRTARLVAAINNPSSIQYFSSVDAKVESDCFRLSIARKFQQIAPRQSLDIVADVYDVPRNSSFCAVRTTIGYDTSFGQHLDLSRAVNRTILPPEPVLNNSSPVPGAVQATQPIAVPQEKASLARLSDALSSKGNLMPLFIGLAVFAVLFTVMIVIKRRKRIISRSEAAVVQEELMKGKTEKPKVRNPKRDGKIEARGDSERTQAKFAETEKCLPKQKKLVQGKKEKPAKKENIQKTQSFRF